jgi:hypothetical protein
LFSVALSTDRSVFVLRTILPCGVRTFLSGILPERSCTRSSLECKHIYQALHQEKGNWDILYRPVSDRTMPMADLQRKKIYVVSVCLENQLSCSSVAISL